ncbi:MSHA pilin protein mshD [Vibrio sp. JCM 19236]|nr:MSHA pilin protein mshD [Vibrio sp. JCM 19236]
MAAKFTKGFTLIESIIAIVILGLAMITLTSFLYLRLPNQPSHIMKFVHRR